LACIKQREIYWSSHDAQTVDKQQPIPKKLTNGMHGNKHQTTKTWVFNQSTTGISTHKTNETNSFMPHTAMSASSEK
jgi:hypothetical protein